MTLAQIHARLDEIREEIQRLRRNGTVHMEQALQHLEFEVMRVMRLLEEL